jgi:glycine cleavage system H protein
MTADGVRYSPLHMWARKEADGTVTIGITDYAEHQLGEIQYVGLPRVGSLVTRDKSLGEVESTKTASELYAPCTGSVLAVNDAVVREPGIVNREPFGAGWMVRIEPADDGEFETLLEHVAYQQYLANDDHSG